VVHAKSSVSFTPSFKDKLKCVSPMKTLPTKLAKSCVELQPLEFEILFLPACK